MVWKRGKVVFSSNTCTIVQILWFKKIDLPLAAPISIRNFSIIKWIFFLDDLDVMKEVI